MSLCFKKYRLVKSDKFEEFLIACGVNYFLRKLAKSASSTVQLIKEADDSYSFHTVTTFVTTLIKFVPDEEFIEDTADGRKIKCRVTFEGNKMIQQQMGDHAIRIEREFFDDELITRCIMNDVVATRWFKPIE